MELKTLFVMDPLDRIQVAGDSTYMLMREATDRGWPVWMCTPQDLYAIGDTARGRVTPVRTTREAPHFHTAVAEDRPLGDFDVVWMRKDPPFDMGYIFSTYLLDLVPETTLVLNHPPSLRHANEKMFALQWAQYCPPTLVTREPARAMAWIREAPGDVVLKPWDGNGGRGVLVSRASDANLRSMLEVLTHDGHWYILIQHYVPEIVKGDKRIILIDGEPKGWMLRVPQPGDHRGNMHVGATVQATELTKRDQEICAAIGPSLRAHGLLFVGIDVIGDYMTEINVTSPTGIQECNRLMGLRLEQQVSDAVAHRVAARRAGRV